MLLRESYSSEVTFEWDLEVGSIYEANAEGYFWRGEKRDESVKVTWGELERVSWS